MPNRRSFSLSAQQIDPLSWFTGPYVPLAFSGLSLVYGALLIAITWGDGGQPWLQLPALLLGSSAGVITHVATRPLRQQIGWGTGALVLGFATAGMIISAFGYAGSSFSIELWWAPGVLSLTIGGLGPYLAVRKVVVLGCSATIVATLAALTVVGPIDFWGAVGTAIIFAYAPVLGVVVTGTFSYEVVSRMLPMIESPSRIMVAGQQVKDDAAEQIERVTIARLTARAAPFLESIADAGRITPADRALAGQLARRIRDELVTQSRLSWLDSIASESRLVVVDPDHRARRMNSAQRTVLRGMLHAILDTPGIDNGSLMVELRAAPDGATAVGVSLDMALPEGRRVMHLAPYYLTLKTAVDDLSFDHDRLLKLSFSFGEDSDARS